MNDFNGGLRSPDTTMGATSVPTLPRSRRICMVTHSFYEGDNRVIRYAEALAGHGDTVEVLALRRSPTQPVRETLNGVVVHRIQDRFGKIEGTPWSYLWPLLRFLVVCERWISRARTPRLDLVHIHNIPDFMIFAGRPARRRGAPLILDIHDIVPEFFGSKFGAAEHSLLVRGLRWIEKRSAGYADHVILANHLWLERYTQRSAPAAKCSVFINHVDRDIFRVQSAQPARKADGRGPLILFPGGLQWHQGLDIAIRAFAILKQSVPGARFHIYGDGSAKKALLALSADLGQTDSISFFDPLSLRDIARVMAGADLGVVPKRADSFGNEAYSTKIMEFMSVGVPVVVSSTRVDRHYFDESVVRFFESGNEEDLARAMLEVLSNSAMREALVVNASRYAAANSWESRRGDYLHLVDDLIDRKTNVSLA